MSPVRFVRSVALFGKIAGIIGDFLCPVPSLGVYRRGCQVGCQKIGGGREPGASRITPATAYAAAAGREDRARTG